MTPRDIATIVGAVLPESGSCGADVGLAEAVAVALGVAVAVGVALALIVPLGVGVTVAIGVPVGVGVGIPVAIGLGVGVPKANFPIEIVNGSQEIAVCTDSLAAGWLSGAVGDDVALFFCNSKAVKTAIAASTAVSPKIEIVIIVFLFITVILKPT